MRDIIPGRKVGSANTVRARRVEKRMVRRVSAARKRCVGEVVYSLLKYSLTLEAINFALDQKNLIVVKDAIKPAGDTVLA